MPLKAPSLVRRLTPTEIDAYDMITPDLARRVRVVAIPALPGRYVGMTLGRVVLLAKAVPDDGSSTLLAHELVHVRQWAELGVVGFSGRYLLSFLAGLWARRRWMAAYRSINAEVDARREATDWLRRRTRDRMEQEGPGPDDGAER